MDVVGADRDADGATVVLGVNLDDLGDHRPGQRRRSSAARRSRSSTPVHQGRRPRRVAAVRPAHLGQAGRACLASRVPYGTEVSVAVLGRVERAEAALRALGFAQCGCATTATPPGSRSSSTAAAAVAARQDVSPPSRPPATATSRSTSRASGRATSTLPSPDPALAVTVGRAHRRHPSVSINVSDTQRSLGVLRGVLGMAVLPRPDFWFGGAWLDAGNGHRSI